MNLFYIFSFEGATEKEFHTSFTMSFDARFAIYERLRQMEVFMPSFITKHVVSMS